MERNYYLVRAFDSSQKYFDAFFNNSIVGVGWSDIDFTKYSLSDLKEVVRKEYYDKSDYTNSHIGRKLNQAIRFAGINKDDVIIVPYYSSIRIAKATNKHFYSKEHIDIDLGNQLRVHYLMQENEFITVPRYELTEGLQRRLRVPGSAVSDFYEFKEEIDTLIDTLRTEDKFTYTNKISREIESHLVKMRKKLLEKIQSGNTHLAAGGIGLEKLVRELFQIEGYDAGICAKTIGQGIADVDIKASKSDRILGTTTVYAQVKHHSGMTGEFGLDQLSEYQKQIETEGNCKFVFITTGRLSKNIVEEINVNGSYQYNGIGIMMIDGEMLVEWIFENIGKLSYETKTQLGLFNSPLVFG